MDKKEIIAIRQAHIAKSETCRAFELHRKLKKKGGREIILIVIGTRCLTFNDDAERLVTNLGLQMDDVEGIPFTGFHKAIVGDCLSRLTKKRQRIAVCDVDARTVRHFAPDTKET